MKFKWSLQVNIFFRILFCLMSFGASACAVSINFSDLEHLQSNELALEYNQGARIRGFLYKTGNGEIVLASEPNLKSCCVGSASRRKQQVLVKGALAIEEGYAVLLEGKLAWDSVKEQFVLSHASIVEENKMSFSLFAAIAALVVGIAAVLYRVRSQK